MGTKWLRQLYYLNIEIKRDKARYDELQAEAEKIVASISLQPKSTDISDKVGRIAIESAELSAAIAKKEFDRDLILEYINNLEDAEMRLIFKYKYIDGYSWQNIAFKMGYTDESTPRKKHNKYLGIVPKNPNLQNYNGTRSS